MSPGCPGHLTVSIELPLYSPREVPNMGACVGILYDGMLARNPLTHFAVCR